MLAYPALHDAQMAANHLPASPTPLYDPRGRQKTFVESTMQRRERIEFLKQREWVRRVAEWVKETNAQNYPPIFGRSSRSYSPFSCQDACVGSPASAVPFPCVEEEEEPYIIYSSSPNSSLSSLSEEITPVLPLNNGPPPSLGPPVAHAAQRRPSGHHRRRSSASLRGHSRKQSLSSICEVPEEDC